MSKVDVLAVMENVAQSLPMYSAIDGLRYSKADMLKAAAAVYELIKADCALDELRDMPVQREPVPDLQSRLAAAWSRRRAALARVQP